jgi:hypothetical protein
MSLMWNAQRARQIGYEKLFKKSNWTLINNPQI